MKTVLIAAAALAVGVVLGIVLRKAAGRWVATGSIFRSVTRFLFITTQICALGWVSVSYGIAVYSTVILMQPFPVVDLSQQAITTLLGMAGMKVLENIFEHNEGAVFGRNKGDAVPDDHERNNL